MATAELCMALRRFPNSSLNCCNVMPRWVALGNATQVSRAGSRPSRRSRFFECCILQVRNTSTHRGSESDQVSCEQLDALVQSEVDRFSRASLAHPITVWQILSQRNAASYREFLLVELPVRYAQRVKMIESLDNWHTCAHLRAIRVLYIDAFKRLQLMSDAEHFRKTLVSIKRRHSNMLPLVIRGSHFMVWSGSDVDIMDKFLDEFLTARIWTDILSSQYLALTRPEGPTTVMDPLCDPVEIVRVAAADAVRLCKYHYSVSPSVIVSDSVQVKFPCISAYLSYIMFELIKNSLRAVVERFDSSSLDNHPVQVAMGLSGKSVVIRVSDTGGGIPVAALQHIWSYMYTTVAPASIDQANKVSNLESDVEKLADDDDVAPMAGFGVGLPLSRTYASFQGGDLRIESTPGFGTDAYLYVPYLDAETVDSTDLPIRIFGAKELIQQVDLLPEQLLDSEKLPKSYSSLSSVELLQQQLLDSEKECKKLRSSVSQIELKYYELEQELVHTLSDKASQESQLRSSLSQVELKYCELEQELAHTLDDKATQESQYLKLLGALLCMLSCIVCCIVVQWWHRVLLARREEEESSVVKTLHAALWDQREDDVQNCLQQLQACGWDVGRIQDIVKRTRKSQSEEAGLSVAYLLSDEFLNLARKYSGKNNPSFYDLSSFFEGSNAIGKDTVCPRDGLPGCAFVDTLPPEHRRACTHYLSWCWSFTVEQVRESLCMFIDTTHLDPQTTFLFVCFFADNQYRILISQKEAGSDDLEQIFERRISRIGKVVALLDTWDNPVYLTRIWTIFEQYMAIKLKLPVVMILPPDATASLISELQRGEPGIFRLKESLSRVHSEQAIASIEKDELKVKSMIAHSVGFETVDKEVRNFLLAWIGQMLSLHVNDLLYKK